MTSGVALGALLSYSLPRLKASPRSLARGILIASVLLFHIMSLPAPARAWGCKGHQTVALLAEMHLSPRALATAKKILADGPIDPSLSRYCKEGGADPLADASTWPDDIRPFRPETPPWHYIDVPRGTAIQDVEKFCNPKEGCVLSAIKSELAFLRSSDANPEKRAEALRFLIHFVGDLHQPLHGVTNNDQGGNCVPVTFFDFQPQLRNPQTESYAPNLHAVWDTNILERATMGKTVEEVARDLNQSFRSKIVDWQKGPANIDAWASESFRLGSKYVYGKLPAQIPVEALQPVKSCADDNHVSARMLKLDERLEEPYQAMAVPIVRERLAQAGARLAMLLNQLWP